MIISKTALVFITFLIIFSVFVANVTNLISVEIGRERDDNQLLKKRATQQNRQHGNRTGAFNHRMERLLWFMQISDIHISIFQDKSRITELQEFCDVTLSVIKPKVVLASGDLTDAKTSDHIGSRQYEDEWKNYRNVLDKCKVSTKTKWLDIRGNHDNFNVASIDSHENFFQNYSMQGRKHRRSYVHEETLDNELYTFMAIDATVDPGPRRPFNFVGILSDEEMLKVQKMAYDAVHQKGTKYLIWFGHFPTSCILTTNVGGIRELIAKFDESVVYVCGHLHQLGGLVKNMYTMQQAGFLELELADWKDNRMYRLLAIDNGFFSFIDARHNDWPQALVTNPKHALYMMPNKEPVQQIEQSTHVRILAFSVSPIESVRMKIDDLEWVDCKHVEGPLYVAKWEPLLYKYGIHHIYVNVRDVQGRDKVITQPFALDNTRLDFNILAKIALMTNASTMFQFMYGTLVLFCVIPLCILRYIHRLVKANKMQKPKNFNNCYMRWLRKLWSVVTIDRIFYPLVLYPLYLSVGPWSIGYIIENHFGVIFAWGIFVRNAYLPGSFTYVYGFVQLFMFQVPFTFILANCVDYRINCILDGRKKLKKWYKKVFFNVPFFVVMSIQLVFAYFFWLAYGTVAFVLGPLRTWTIVLALVLYWQSLKLPEMCCREAINILYMKNKTEPTEEEDEIDKNTYLK